MAIIPSHINEINPELLSCLGRKVEGLPSQRHFRLPNVIPVKTGIQKQTRTFFLFMFLSGSPAGEPAYAGMTFQIQDGNKNEAIKLRF
jgi:hypothetical protein